MKVGAKIEIPHVFIIGVDPNGNPIYTGTSYYILKGLSDSLNFRYVIVEPKDGGACYDGHNYHKLVGYCQELMKNEVQLAGLPYGIDNYAFHFFDPTAVFLQVRNVLVSATPTVNTKLYAAIDPWVMGSVLISMLFVTFVIWMLNKFSHSPSDDGFVDILFDAIAIFFLEGEYTALAIKSPFRPIV